MRTKDLICPECHVLQDRKDVRSNWFPCHSCGANLRIVYRFGVSIVWLALVLALVLIWLMHLRFWIAALICLPLTYLIGVGIFALLSALDLDRLESDKPSGPHPGSPLGLNG